jgi:hypothetical protein
MTSSFIKPRKIRAEEFLSAADVTTLLKRNMDRIYRGRAARLTASLNEDIPSGDFRKIPYDAALFDTSGGGIAAGDGKILLDEEGFWLAGVNHQMEAAFLAGAVRDARILLNDQWPIAQQSGFISTSFARGRQTAFGTWYAQPQTEPEFIEGLAKQNSGTELSTIIERDYACDMWAAQLTGLRSAETWTPPKTWLTTERLDKAAADIHIRGNQRWLRSRPAIRMLRAFGAARHANNVWQIIDNFDAFQGDAYGMLEPGTSDETIKIKRAGVYLVVALAGHEANATGWRGARVRKNGTSTIAEGQGFGVASGWGTLYCLGTLELCAVNDTLTLECFQDSGADLDTLSRRYYTPQFFAILISDTATPPTWTDPPTWERLDELTASELNTYLRDNSLFLYGPPCVKAVRATAQALTNAAWTSLQFNAADEFDNDAMHNPASNNTRIVINRPGAYLFGGNGNVAANATAFRGIRIRKNGSEANIIADHWPYRGSAGFGTRMGILSLHRFDAGDYFEVQVWQNSGGALNTEGGQMDGFAVRIAA